MTSLFLHLSITLLLAHLISDFLLQPQSLLKKKKKILWMVMHCLIHGIIVYLLLGIWTEWLVPAIIVLSHFVIDSVKIRVKKVNLTVFLIDQFFHLIVLAILIIFVLNPKGVMPTWFRLFDGYAVIAVYLTAILLLVPVGGVLIGYFVQPFQNQIRYQQATKGLENGGKVIGWLERVLIFIFVLVGQYAGVGFLIAAKSIFRFGELKENQNRKEAEYIIIGTFASFLYAILVSLLAKWILGL